jgi:hypothetical protein
MVSGVSGQPLPPAARTPQTDARWLELRVRADNAARAVTAGTLLPRLVHHLATSGAGDSGVEVIDLGSGTGANQRWLAPRLPFGQRWLLIDQDQALQHHKPVAPRTRLLTADVGILTSVLDRLGRAQLVTCSALLDVLTLDQLDAMGSALAVARQPALFSLTVTGAMDLSPTHSLDSDLSRAFNDHQRRGGRAGPDAVRILTRALRATGCMLWTTETPWLVDRHNDGEFVRRFLTDRVAAAVAHDPSLSSAGAVWLALRLAQLAEHALEISVGHRDMLVLPR